MAGVPRILTLNAGSSSLKAAVYELGATETVVASARIDRIGLSGGRLRTFDGGGRVAIDEPAGAGRHAGALASVLRWMRGDSRLLPVSLVVHRVVHGGTFTEPQRITSEVIAELNRLVSVDPDHLPQTIEAVETIARTLPDVPQLACFDTAFHSSMPSVARAYPLPSSFTDAGVRRYGFHGLSCESIVSILRMIDPAAADGRMIIAHLGNGASMTALSGGRSIDTTMGFSPAGGLMMGTRTGDLDPGVLLYVLRDQRMTATDLNRVINRESGLLGVSGTTSDMQDLLAREATDRRAAAAIALFCYLARKSIGALLAALGRLETLVFTGGIGEHSPIIRQRILEGLDGLGLELDGRRNRDGAPIISADASRVVIRVIGTDEDRILARHARRFLEAEQSDPVAP